jgi:hypothetical protein
MEDSKRTAASAFGWFTAIAAVIQPNATWVFEIESLAIVC